MPSSDGKKSSNLKENPGVSVKRKSSTSPSILHRTPMTKKKISQQSSSPIKSLRSSYNLRNSHSSKSTPSDEVKQYISLLKDQKQSSRHKTKATDRCSFCSHFIPADSSSCVYYSCQAKYSEPRVYKSSRRSTALKLASTAAKKTSEEEPKAIAAVPAIELKEILLPNKRQRSKRIVRPNRPAQIENEVASVLLRIASPKLVLDKPKPVNINMATKSKGIIKQKPIEQTPVRCSKRAKCLSTAKANMIAEIPNESFSNLKSAKIPDENVWNPKKIAETPNRNVSNSKAIAETPNLNVSNSKDFAETPNKNVSNSKEIAETPNESVWNPKEITEIPNGNVSNSKEIAETPHESFFNTKRIAETPYESIWNPKKIAETPNRNVSNSNKITETTSKNVSNSKEAYVEPKLSRRAVVTRSKRLGTVLKESLFHSTEAIVKKRRNADAPSSDCLTKEAKSAVLKNAVRSPAVVDGKRKRKTYDCDQCKKSFSPRQHFRSHRRECKLKLPKARNAVSVDDNSDSFLSVFSEVVEEGAFEVNPEGLVLNVSNNVEENSSIKEPLDNVHSSETAEEANELSSKVVLLGSCGETSLECVNPSSTRGKVCEKNSTFDEALSNAESCNLPKRDTSLSATEMCSENIDSCLKVLKTSLDEKDSSLDPKESCLDTREQCSSTEDPCLDAAVLNLDVTQDTTDNLRATEANLNDAEPILKLKNTTEDNLDVCLDSTLGLDSTESTLDLPVPSLEVIQHSLNASEPNLYLEESCLNSKVHSDTTHRCLDTKKTHLVKKIIKPCFSKPEPVVNATKPSLDTTASCFDTIAPTLNVSEDCIDAIECVVAVPKPGLKGTKLDMDILAPLVGKSELCVDGKKSPQLNLEGLETTSQGQKTCYGEEWVDGFEEPHPSFERLEPSFRAPECNLQFSEFFLKGTDQCLEGMEGGSKNSAPSPEGFECNLHDPGFDLEGLRETESRLPGQKGSMEVDSIVTESMSNEEKSRLGEIGTILEGSIGKDSDFSGKELCSKEMELDVKDPESSIDDVGEFTVEEKEWCIGGGGDHLLGTESHIEVAKVSSEGQNSCLVENNFSTEEVQIIFCPQITSVFSVSDDSKLETEPKEEITSCSVSESSNNGHNANSRNLSETKDKLKAESSYLSRMPSSTNDIPDNLKAEEFPKQASQNRKICGKRKPEDSVKGKEPLSSHNRSSFNKLDDTEIFRLCRSCGKTLSFPNPSNNARACVIDRNICFSSEIACRDCRDIQNVQFSLPTKSIVSTFNHHLTKFVSRGERMSHKSLKEIRVLFKDFPPNYLTGGDSILCQNTQKSVDFSCQLRTLDPTHTDALSLVMDTADLTENLPCTPPSTVSEPPSPLSCSGSLEDPTPRVAQAEPAEITLTEHMCSPFDVYRKGSGDRYLCMKFKSEACLQPLRKADIAMHFFTTHDSSELRGTFNLLHEED